MRENRPLEMLVTADEAWSCTTCAACVRACPFEIEVLDKLVDLRRGMVEAGAVDPAAARALEGIAERGNPFGGVPADRLAWAAGLDVRVLQPGDETDVLDWVGCAGAFDPHGRRIAQATARLLQAGGVEFGVLGVRGACTGDPARRIGDETAFREAAGRVATTLGGVRFRRLVTHCAHCFNVFRNELGPATDRPAVTALHHSQILSELVAASRLSPRAATAEPVTLHDPCYLARHNGETAGPRAVLATTDGGPDPTAAQRPGDVLLRGRRRRCVGRGAAGLADRGAPDGRGAGDRGARGGDRVPFCCPMLAGETQPGDVAVRDVSELLLESQPVSAAPGVANRGPA